IYPTHQKIKPTKDHSKGAQGLSVLLSLFRIITEISISLNQYWRQWGSRYTIHAGRNLPDKEFRYLRTVMVTAAVYWDLHSKHYNNTSPYHLTAPGRSQILYFII